MVLIRLQPWILNLFCSCVWNKLKCFCKHFFGNRYLSVNVCSLIILWCWLCFLHSDSLNALLACATKMIDRRVSFRTNNKHQQLTQSRVLMMPFSLSAYISVPTTVWSTPPFTCLCVASLQRIHNSVNIPFLIEIVHINFHITFRSLWDKPPPVFPGQDASILCEK